MSTQEASGEKGNLALFLSGSFQINGKQELGEFLEKPKSREIVRSAPYQDVFLVIKTVGLGHSLELLQLTTGAQRRGFVDLDCWRKDSFHIPSFMEWLAAFVQCGPEESASAARAIDPNLLALFLKENVEVFALELDEPPPDLPLIFTPDNRFGVQVTGEGKNGILAQLLLDAIFRFDPSLGYDLIDRVRWENRVSLEEEAYQDKRRRLEEIGFVDYYEALEIYGEAHDRLSSTKAPSSRPTGDLADVSTTLPALFVASLPSGHYLLQALQKIDDKEQADKIRQGLAALANRILSVHTVTPGDLEKVRPALEEICDTLSVALEHLACGDVWRASEVLRHHDVQSLFKIGFNLTAALRSEAEQILAQGSLRLEGCRETLLDSPDREFFDGLRRLQPRFYQGLEEPPKSLYRNFQLLKDIDLARKRLWMIASMAKGFWSLFSETSARAALAGLNNRSLRTNELRFNQVFNTACLNLAAGGGFQPVSLPVSVVLKFLEASLGGNSAEELLAGLDGQAQKWIAHRVEDPFARSVLSSYGKTWLRAFAEEVLPLLREARIEPRLIRSIILQEPGEVK